MNPDLEIRIKGRNQSRPAFAEVGQSVKRIEGDIAGLHNILNAAPRLWNAVFAGAAVASIQVAVNAVAQANKEVAATGRLAETAGLSFKSYQTLGWAAERNQIAVQSLAQGIREMQDKASEFAANGGGRAAEALRAMGFDAKTTAEALKEPEGMFKDIIDRLGDLDRASQIRFAGDLFGGGAGDEFLKFLKNGKEGIEALQDEAVDSGLVLGDELEAAAARADAAFDKLWRQVETKWKTFAVTIADSFTSAPEPGQAVSSMGGRGSAAGAARIEALGLGPAPAPIKPGFFLGTDAGGDRYGSGVNPSGQTSNTTDFGFRDFLDKNARDSLEGLPDLFSTTGGAVAQVNKEVDVFRELMSSISPLLEESRDPFDQMAFDINQLDIALAAGKISWEDYGKAVQKAQSNATQATLASVGQITGILAGAFEDNKAFAVANAAVNTAEGITKALAQGGMFAWPTAIAIGAAGAAQISSILSSSPGSGSVAPVSAAGGNAGAGATMGSGLNITVRGHANNVMTVADFVKEMTDSIRDGGYGDYVNVMHEAMPA